MSSVLILEDSGVILEWRKPARQTDRQWWVVAPVTERAVGYFTKVSAAAAWVRRARAEGAK